MSAQLPPSYDDLAAMVVDLTARLEQAMSRIADLEARLKRAVPGWAVVRAAAAPCAEFHGSGETGRSSRDAPLARCARMRVPGCAARY
jgi:hypothetical protein